MPFSLGENISDIPVNILIRSSDQNVGRSLDELFKDPADLLRGLALAEDHFREALPRTTSVINTSIADVFVGKILDPCDSIRCRHVAGTELRKKILEIRRVHFESYRVANSMAEARVGIRKGDGLRRARDFEE